MVQMLPSGADEEWSSSSGRGDHTFLLFAGIRLRDLVISISLFSAATVLPGVAVFPGDTILPSVTILPGVTIFPDAALPPLFHGT